MPRYARMELTDTRCLRARAKVSKGTGKLAQQFEWDSKIHGFCLRVNVQANPKTGEPETGSKRFYLRYTSPGTGNEKKRTWLPLGDYTGPESLKAAREKAIKAKEDLENLRDPRIERKKHLEIPTLAKYVQTYLAVQKPRLRDGSYKPAKAMLEGLVVPVLGDFRISEIQTAQVSQLFHDISRGWRPWMKPSEKPERPTPIRANRMHANLRKLFRQAEKDGLRPQGSNPCVLIEKNPESKGKERFLTPEEISWIGRVLREAPSWANPKTCPYAWKDGRQRLETPSVYALAAIRLLMFTGARLNEILQLRWSQVDKGRGVIRLERHKTSGKSGAKEIPLNGAALAVLEFLSAQPKMIPPHPFVIRGHKHGEHLVNLQKPWDRIRQAVRLASGGVVNIQDVRMHDLRHTFASVGVGLGVTLHQVGDLLGHSQAATTHRYAHLDVDPRLQASEKISAAIAASLG